MPNLHGFYCKMNFNVYNMLINDMHIFQKFNYAADNIIFLSLDVVPVKSENSQNIQLLTSCNTYLCTHHMNIIE